MNGFEVSVLLEWMLTWSLEQYVSDMHAGKNEILELSEI